MAILEGPAGDFLGSIALSVIVMLLASMLLALTVTPVLAARLLPSGLSDEYRWWQAGIDLPRVSQVFAKLLTQSLRNPTASIALALCLPVTGFLCASSLTNQFFPGTDRDQLYLQVTLAESASIDDALSLAKKIDADLAEPNLFQDHPERAQTLSKDRGLLAKKIEGLEEDWLEALAVYEAAEAEADVGLG